MSQGTVEKAVRLPKARGLKEDAFNLPNIITMFRVVMIPIVMVLLQEGTPVMNYWAGWVYTIATITDAIDGWLARRRGLVSVVGKFLDPLADKLLVMATLVLMVSMGRVPAWVVVIILGRELSISMLRMIASSEGVVIAAGEGGKAKTALQMIAVLFLMLHHPYEIDFWFATLTVDFNLAGTYILYLSVFFAITSAGEYVKLFVEAVEAKDRRIRSGT
ncbi:MAG TPA: CDP-diacylglycerol--glycerol-3-phosphate 3-phosphatidyltransferase [Polyangiales bacterium]|nr:CDP-diacylglycerol--glycerol-3-phosphate 3-phosphatidyltransferase [Polyangiales bacterium]